MEIYLTAKKRREIEERLVKAYAGQGDTMLEEVEELLGGQAWPSKSGRDLAARSLVSPAPDAF